MRFPLSFRVARACALATLLSSLGLAPSFAHMGAGPAPALGRVPDSATSNISRRMGSTGALKVDGLASIASARTGSIASASIASIVSAETSFSLAAAGGGAVGAGTPLPQRTSPFAGGGAPIIINIGVDPGPGDAGALGGGCVIHKLTYDNAGKYVGERQIPHC